MDVQPAVIPSAGVFILCRFLVCSQFQGCWVFLHYLLNDSEPIKYRSIRDAGRTSSLLQSLEQDELSLNVSFFIVYSCGKWLFLLCFRDVGASWTGNR